MSEAAWVTIGLIVTSLFAQVYTAWSVERKRGWDIEDRKNEALLLAQKSEAEARKVRLLLESQQQCNANAHDELIVKIDDNTQKSVRAFQKSDQALHAANSINEKMFQAQQTIMSVQLDGEAVAGSVDEVKAISIDTNAVARRIEENQKQV